MNGSATNFATQEDLAKVRLELKGDIYEVRQQVKQLRFEMIEMEGRIYARMDAKFDYFAEKIVNEISEVLNDMMVRIDRRFRRQ